jgi:thioesterase domain-containing protein
MLAVAKHLRKQQALLPSQQSPVVEMRRCIGGVPVYWIEPDLNGFKIGQLITANNPIYAIEIRRPSVWYDLAARNERNRLPTIEQMVTPYVAAIKAHIHTSRCVLCGHSFGGVMAFEAARQLAHNNIQVETTLLLDAAAVYPSSHKRARQKLREIWFPAANTPSAASTADRLAKSLLIVRWSFGCKWGDLVRRIANASTRAPERLTTRLDDMGKPVTWPQIKYVYDTAISSYCMSQLDCGGVLFRAESKEDSASRSLERHLGWDGLFRKGLEIVPVPGDHLSMLGQPHAEALAHEISRVLGTIPEEQEHEAACAASEQCSELLIAGPTVEAAS